MLTSPTMSPTTLFLPLILAALSLLLISCSGTDPTPTRTRDHLAQQFDDLQTETASLRAEADSLHQRQAQPPPSSIPHIPHTNPPPPSQSSGPHPTPPTAPAPITPPTAIPFPTHSGPSICSRTPEVQHSILKALGTSSCRIVTNDELFRITSLPGNLGQLKAGDLSGLVNIRQLSLSGDYTIPANTFAGSAIDNLELGKIDTHPDAFNGMLTLKELTLTHSTTVPLKAPVFATLESFHIHIHSSGKPATNPPDPDLTAAMPNLKHYAIHRRTEPGENYLSTLTLEERNPDFTLPPNLFENNPAIQSVEIHHQHETNYFDTEQGGISLSFHLIVPHSMLEHLHHLEALSITGSPRIKARPIDGPKLRYPHAPRWAST